MDLKVNLNFFKRDILSNQQILKLSGLTSLSKILLKTKKHIIIYMITYKVSFNFASLKDIFFVKNFVNYKIVVVWEKNDWMVD